MKHPREFSPEDRLAAGFLRKITRGQTGSLAELYALYHRPLLGLIHSIVKESGASEEILQDVFVRVYERAFRYDPELGTPFVWMATIGKRMAFDWLRKNRRRPQFVAIHKEQGEEFADKDYNEESPGIRNHLEATWALETFGGLPPGQREALELVFLRGYSQQEVAEALGKPLGSVKSDLRRGLLRLRKLYLGEDDRH